MSESYPSNLLAENTGLAARTKDSGAGQEFLSDVLQGLSESPKRLECKYLYDQRGSQLFDAICELPEYYPTRTELAIMRTHAAEMAEVIGPAATLIELGSGSSLKTRVLLDELLRPTAYVPVDISGDHLHRTAGRLQRVYPEIEILPVAADFSQPFEIPAAELARNKHVVYFPGSTIGNFERAAAIGLLRQHAQMCDSGDGLLLGFDLVKDIAILEAAYNDKQGVTARFSTNLLHRINRELGGDIAVEQFRHSAHFDEGESRIDIRLVSQADQNVKIAGREFAFAKDEPILTEYSHKYTPRAMQQLAREAGWRLKHLWTDPQELFAVAYFDL